MTFCRWYFQIHFCEWKNFIFWLKFHWALFLNVQLIIFFMCVRMLNWTLWLNHGFSQKLQLRVCKWNFRVCKMPLLKKIPMKWNNWGNFRVCKWLYCLCKTRVHGWLANTMGWTVLSCLGTKYPLWYHCYRGCTLKVVQSRFCFLLLCNIHICTVWSNKLFWIELNWFNNKPALV